MGKQHSQLPARQPGEDGSAIASVYRGSLHAHCSYMLQDMLMAPLLRWTGLWLGPWVLQSNLRLYWPQWSGGPISMCYHMQLWPCHFMYMLHIYVFAEGLDACHPYSTSRRRRCYGMKGNN